MTKMLINLQVINIHSIYWTGWWRPLFSLSPYQTPSGRATRIQSFTLSYCYIHATHHITNTILHLQSQTINFTSINIDQEEEDHYLLPTEATHISLASCSTSTITTIHRTTCITHLDLMDIKLDAFASVQAVVDRNAHTLEHFSLGIIIYDEEAILRTLFTLLCG